MIKDYSTKSYKNPLFQKKKQRSPINKKFIVFFAILAVLAGVFFMFKTNMFVISTTQIKGNTTIPSAEIQDILAQQLSSKRFFVFDQKYIFFFHVKKAGERIEELYSLKNLKIEKKYPNTLNITIEEKKPVLIAVQNSNAYFIDEEGSVVSALREEDLKEENFSDYNILRHIIIYKNIPIIEITDTQALEINSAMTDSEDFIKIKKIIQNIFEQKSFNINFFEYSKTQRTFSAVTIDSLKIYFDFDGNIDDQLQKLGVILENKEKVGTIKEYIDLRYGDKVFYK